MEPTHASNEALRGARLPLLLYRIVFPILFIVALPFYLLRMRRRERGRAGNTKPDGYHLGIGQRFGFYGAWERAWMQKGGALWIHSISVGETLVALKLARQIHTLDPHKRIVLSTTTSTGFEVALEGAAGNDWLLPIYNPVDLRGAARRALNAIQPDQVILIEGEIWPNLVSLCCKRGIPVTLANARLSTRSGGRFVKFRRFTGPIFRLLKYIFVQDEDDASRFLAIGAEPAQIRYLGSIKYDQGGTTSSHSEALRTFIALLGFGADCPLIVAGSTWGPEEKILSEVFIQLRGDFPKLKLILVPRHVERAAAIRQEVKALGLKVTLRSEPENNDEIDALLVDTTGELQDWYRLATVVFVGKSLPGVAQKGGQNIGEPAGLGLPVVCGPHMGNFQALIAGLLRKEAILQVADSTALKEALSKLLWDSGLRHSMGAAAASVIEAHRGATHRSAQMILWEKIL